MSLVHFLRGLRHLTLLGIINSCVGARSSPGDVVTASDSSAIARVKDLYVQAWLADDTAAVLALFAPDGLIVPPGKSALVGHDAIRDHWWPRDGSTTKLHAFRWTADQLLGADSLAVTRGESFVVWEYRNGNSVSIDSSRSADLTVLKKSADGRWYIVQQAWGPALK